MADDRWQRVADLYQSAQDRSPEERLAFVRQASGADSGLRREVESLLAQDIKTGAIDELIAAAARSLLADNAGVQPGSFIGPYSGIRVVSDQAMFKMPLVDPVLTQQVYDVDEKGERFLIPTTDSDRPNVVDLMVNWPELLKQ